jgi:hypothetical protein
MTTLKKHLMLFSLLLIAGLTRAQQTETREVPAFSKLQIGGSFDAVLRQGNETSVKIIAENIDTKKIHTETNGSTLRISLEKGFYRNIKIKLEITYKNPLDAIDRSGSGNLTCVNDISATGDFGLSSSGSGNINIQGTIKAANVSVARSGSGNMKLAGLQADRLQMSFSGSGNADLNGGNAKTQTIHLSGSGNVNAYGLQTEICTVAVSGSGNIKVNANSSIEAVISGSGNIDYRGNAQVTKMKVSGSGRINKKA